MIIAILITAFTRIKETDEERKGREPQLAMRMMFATSYARAQAAATKLSAKLSRRWLLSKEEKKREARRATTPPSSSARRRERWRRQCISRAARRKVVSGGDSGEPRWSEFWAGAAE